MNEISDEFDAILAKVQSTFVQTVSEGIPDATLTEYQNGSIVPYLTVDFGTPVASATDRGLTSETTQPTMARVIVSSVAGTKKIARDLGSKVAREMIGYKPSTASDVLRAVGGNNYTLTFDANQPTAYVSEMYFMFKSNLAPDYS